MIESIVKEFWWMNCWLKFWTLVNIEILKLWLTSLVSSTYIERLKVSPRQSIFHVKKNSKSEIASAGSLDIRNFKNYWQLVTANFEPKLLLNFINIWKKFRKKEPSDLDKRKKYEKSHMLAEKSVSRKKKVKRKCACCFASKFIL